MICDVPVALQLYTLRETLVEDVVGVMQKVAGFGYVGVEPFADMDHQEAVKIIRDLGLAAPSIHIPLPVGADRNKALDMAAAYGCQYLVSGRGPDEFSTLDAIKRSCELFNEANQIATDNGYVFAIHNHWWEFLPVEGRYVYQIMLELLDPTIQFEIDVYWVQTAGPDPASVIRALGERVPLLHIKDGPAVQDEPMVAVGEGKVDIPGVVRAGSAAEWLIVELDRCATDMLEAVEKSARYLIGEGLGRGSQS